MGPPQPRTRAPHSRAIAIPASSLHPACLCRRGTSVSSAQTPGQASSSLFPTRALLFQVRAARPSSRGLGGVQNWGSWSPTCPGCRAREPGSRGGARVGSGVREDPGGYHVWRHQRLQEWVWAPLSGDEDPDVPGGWQPGTALPGTTGGGRRRLQVPPTPHPREERGCGVPGSRQSWEPSL